jgi:N-acetylmuramoyl-L-alanine amidase
LGSSRPFWGGRVGAADEEPSTPVPGIRQVPSPNFWQGRPNGPPIAVVLHTMAGTLTSTDGWFQSTASQVSAHYGVGLNGDIHQYVALEDRAWANGILESGNHWPGPRGINPNNLSVSIETEDRGSATQPVTVEQFESVRAVLRIIAQRYPGIRFLLRHTDISPNTRAHCPGDRWVASGRFAQLARDFDLTTAI